MNCTAIQLHFVDDLPKILKQKYRDCDYLCYRSPRRANIKDILESLGIPHTEIGDIIHDKKTVPLSHIPFYGHQYTIHPLSPEQVKDMFTGDGTIRFLVDINVAKLGKLLRMAGVDAEPVTTSDNRSTVELAVKESRIVLSRDKELLKRKELTHGRLLRSEEPFEQLGELFALYQLGDHLKPFSRCMKCNGELVEAPKEKIVQRLLPLTKKYYNNFKECSRCTNVYWRGSHYEKMVAKLAQIAKRS